MELSVRRFRFFFFWAMLIFLFNTNFQLQAQISEEKWEELTRDVDYGENTDKPREPEREREDPPDWNLPRMNKDLLRVIVISAVIILLTFILVRILSNSGTNKAIKKKKKVFSIEEAEEDLEFSELGDLLDQLIEKGDLREALRILYLRSLQLLHEKGKLQWKKEKTNFDYIRELKGTEFQKNFHSLTTVFELKWYGEQEVQSEEFRLIREAFQSFNQSLEE